MNKKRSSGNSKRNQSSIGSAAAKAASRGKAALQAASSVVPAAAAAAAAAKKLTLKGGGKRAAGKAPPRSAPGLPVTPVRRTAARATEPHEQRFVRNLLVRGEAVKPARRGGKLPAGATHEIVQEEPGQLPQVQRRRFSTF